MTEIVFVRHAATDLAGTFCGHLDPPLNGLGHEQIECLVQSPWLTDLTAVYSSDLQRARITAEAIAANLSVPISTDTAWREMNFGAWEGLTWAQIEELDAIYARQWTEAFPHLPTPRGEPHSSFSSRVLQAVRRVQGQVTKRVAVVTHAGVLRVVLQELCGVDAACAWEITREYCCGFRLFNDNKFEVLS